MYPPGVEPQTLGVSFAPERFGGVMDHPQELCSQRNTGAEGSVLDDREPFLVIVHDTASESNDLGRQCLFDFNLACGEVDQARFDVVRACDAELQFIIEYQLL